MNQVSDKTMSKTGMNMDFAQAFEGLDERDDMTEMDLDRSDVDIQLGNTDSFKSF